MEALEAFRANPDRFDLVITDLTMPKMGGVDLSKDCGKSNRTFPLFFVPVSVGM